MRKKALLYAFLFGLLIVAYWAVLYFYTDVFHKSQLTKRSVVHPFTLTNQDGLSFSNDSMMGKIVVVNYFFTTCRGICPMMNDNMKKIYDKFKENNDIMLVSYTCDPDQDTPKQLKKYVDSLGINTKKWIFITGSKDSLYTLARFSYGIDDRKNIVSNIEDDFLHSQFLALVDEKLNVRGPVYDGLNHKDIAQLEKDIHILIDEKNNPSYYSDKIEQ